MNLPALALPLRPLRFAALLFACLSASSFVARAGSPPVIISPSTASAFVNQSFNYQIILANFATGTYSADDLAPGLTLDAKVGAISGAPEQLGTFVITLHASNADGSTSSTLTLEVISPTPLVTLTADVPEANPVRGQAGRFTLTRQYGDLNQPLTVVFTIKGSAQNGVDYNLLSLTKTIKAGKTVKRIHVNPLLVDGDAPGGKKTVKLTLQPTETYEVGEASTAKVKIYFVP